MIRRANKASITTVAKEMLSGDVLEEKYFYNCDNHFNSIIYGFKLCSIPVSQDWWRL